MCSRVYELVTDAADRYGEGVDIPTHAYEHPTVQEIMRVSAEMVILYVRVNNQSGLDETQFSLVAC